MPVLLKPPRPAFNYRSFLSIINKFSFVLDSTPVSHTFPVGQRSTIERPFSPIVIRNAIFHLTESELIHYRSIIGVMELLFFFLAFNAVANVGNELK